MATKKVLVLARGLGTRMQKDAGGAALSPEARRLADSGLKALLPLNGRPFLDYLFGVIVEAGFEKACLVVGPQSDALRAYGSELAHRSGLSVEFAVQQEPRGTGDAVRAGEEFAAGDPFVMLNSDNWMSADGLRVLREARGADEAGPPTTGGSRVMPSSPGRSGVMPSSPGRSGVMPSSMPSSAATQRSGVMPALPGLAGNEESIGLRDTGYEEEYGDKSKKGGAGTGAGSPGVLDAEDVDDDEEDDVGDTAFGIAAQGGAEAGFLLGFERAALLTGNIPADRVKRFAVLDIGPGGQLTRIVEKPDQPERFARDGKLFLSMNCWQMPPSIFDACRAIKPSPRGEYEITDAVQWLIDGKRAEFRVLTRSEPVYDLTGREDLAAVEKALSAYRIPFAPALT